MKVQWKKSIIAMQDDDIESFQFIPLLDLHNRSIPLRFKAILASSTKVSEMLKLTRGETSMKPMEFFSAYSSASSWWTCLLNAK